MNEFAAVKFAKELEAEGIFTVGDFLDANCDLKCSRGLVTKLDRHLALYTDLPENKHAAPGTVRAICARWRLLDAVYVESFVVAPAPQAGSLSGEHAVNSVGRSLGPVVSLVWLLQPRPLRRRCPRWLACVCKYVHANAWFCITAPDNTARCFLQLWLWATLTAPPLSLAHCPGFTRA